MVERLSVEDFTDEQVLEALEAAAAAGNDRAERVLRTALEEEAETGSIHFFSRLAAGPYLFGDRHTTPKEPRPKGTTT